MWAIPFRRVRRLHPARNARTDKRTPRATAREARLDSASAGEAVRSRDSPTQPPLLRLNDRWLAAGPCAERTFDASDLAAISAASACAPRLRARASRNLRLRS